MTGRSSDSGAYAANTEGRTSTKHPAPASTAYVSPGAPLSDSSLIARIFQRDEQALGFLYDRYDRLVYTIALRITNDRAAAEEVVRDVFQGVWQSAGSFQPGGSVSAWLIGIARHRAIDATRTHSYRVQARAAIFDDGHMPTTSENSAGLTDVLTVRAAICALSATSTSTSRDRSRRW